MVNNNTGDPTSILPSFAYPYDVECMWGGTPPVGAGKGAVVKRRPIVIPPSH